jgi:hypothetical protein
VKRFGVPPLLGGATITVKGWKLVAVDPDTRKGTVEVRQTRRLRPLSKMGVRCARHYEPSAVRSMRRSLFSKAT